LIDADSSVTYHCFFSFHFLLPEIFHGYFSFMRCRFAFRHHGFAPRFFIKVLAFIIFSLLLML